MFPAFTSCHSDNSVQSYEWHYKFEKEKAWPGGQGWQKTDKAYFSKIPEGHKYLWLVTRLPPSLSADQVFFIPDVKYKFDVFIDDELIYNQEKKYNREDTSILATGPFIIQLKPEYSNKPLFLRIYSDIDRVGIVGQVRISNWQDAISSSMAKDFWIYLQVFFLLSVALTCLVLLIFGRKVNVLFWLMAFSLFFSIYSLGLMDTKLLLLNDGLFWLHLGIVTFSCLPFLFCFLLRALFYSSPSRILAFCSYISVAACLLLVGGHFSGLFEIQHVFHLYQALIITLATLIMWQLAVWARLGDKLAYSLIITVVLLLIGIVHDVLINRALIPWTGHVSGIFIMIFLVRLSLNIAVSVSIREREQQIYLTELETAEHLHERFFSNKSRHEGEFELDISNYSATKLGGDWFNYQVGNDDWYFIHLGDITGHGIQAALTTTYLQGLADEFRYAARILPPEEYLEEFHRSVNSQFFSRGAGNLTLTLATVAINIKTFDLLYCNSGHPGVIKIAGDKKQSYGLKGRNSSIIGSRADLQEVKVSRDKLEKNQLLIMYSDGINDALGRKDKLASIKRLIAEFCSYEDKTASYIHQVLKDRLAKMNVFERSDDVTLITLGRKQ